MLTFFKILTRSGYQRIFIRNKALEHAPNAQLSKNVIDRYMCLPLPDCKSLINYIWIDGTGEQLRCKTKTLNFVPNSYKEVPTWTFNGHTTYFTNSPANSDLYICPVAMYKDPIRRGNHRLVLCETYQHDHKHTSSNHRRSCIETLNKACEHEPMFGFEQEYHLMDIDKHPFGWPTPFGQPAAPGDYDCGVGALNTYGSDIVEAHYRACLYAGVDILGVKAEVNLSQWEFKLGTTKGIKAGDDLWMARFLLERVAEEFGVAISFFPKLFANMNSSGCHMTFSTKAMRSENGFKDIEAAVEKLEKSHAEFIAVCDPRGGACTKKRLTGAFETSCYSKFTSGVGDRSKSIRIPSVVADTKKGYFEDRRPSGNCDPYQVMGSLVHNLLVEC